MSVTIKCKFEEIFKILCADIKFSKALQTFYRKIHIKQEKMFNLMKSSITYTH